MYIEANSKEEKLKIINSIDSEISDLINDHKKKKLWLPGDLLPDPSKDDYIDKITEIRKEGNGLSYDTKVSLVGNTITEEGLPSYMKWLSDSIGQNGALSYWNRRWTMEEKSHGVVSDRYLATQKWLSMKHYEISKSNEIENGFDPKTGNDPFLALMYTSFQEPATKISHTWVAKKAKEQGATVLSNILYHITADEARHALFYQGVVKKLFKVAPEVSMESFAELIKIGMVMPSKTMYDGVDDNLFDNFELASQKSGHFTSIDYSDIMRQLYNNFGISTLKNLFGVAAKAQDYVSEKVEQYARTAPKILEKTKKQPMPRFSWII